MLIMQDVRCCAVKQQECGKWFKMLLVFKFNLMPECFLVTSNIPGPK